MATFGIAFIVLVVLLCGALAFSLRLPPDPRHPQKGHHVNLFSRAQKGLSLTPAERAFLKLLKGWALAGALSAALAVLQYLALPSVDWVLVGRVAAGAFVVATLMAASKYYTAQGDKPLADVAMTLAGYIGHLNPVPSYGPSSAASTAPTPAAPVTAPAPSVP